MTRSRKDRTFDAAMLMKDAGVIGTSAAAQVGGSDKIIDLEEGGGLDDTPQGSDGTRVDAALIIDVTAIELATGDEIYDILVQVSSSPTFASEVKTVAGLNLADTLVSDGGADDGEIGHYELPFTNEYNGVAFRYARVYTEVAGTVATGIDYVAHIAKAA